MTTYVAGHCFDSTDKCDCGLKWTDIMNVDESYLDAEGYAHNGRLTRTEVAQIQNEKQRRDIMYMAALKDVCSG